MCATILAVVCAFSVALARPLDSCVSFANLAAAHAASAVQGLGPALAATLTESVMPLEVHGVREMTLRVRNIIDAFSPAYPNSSTVCSSELRTLGPDNWQAIRDSLDTGYTALGDFQDLNKSKVPYTPQELVLRRDVVLSWYVQWRAANLTNKYQQFIATATCQSADFRHVNESGFFWGGASTDNITVPGIHMTGISGIRELVGGQLRVISNINAVTCQLVNILPTSAHDKFHDFRKWLRAVLDITYEFANTTVPVFAASAVVDNALALMEALYSKYGDLNDKWTAYYYYEQKGDAKDEKKAAAVVNASWTELRQFQLKNDLNGTLVGLQNSFSSACAGVAALERAL